MLNKIIGYIQGYIQSKEGATAIEYGLIAGGISLAIMAAIFFSGDMLKEIFGTISTALESASERVEDVASDDAGGAD